MARWPRGDFRIWLLSRMKHFIVDRCCFTNSSSSPIKAMRSLMLVKKMVLLPTFWRGDRETMIESHSLTGRSSRTNSMRVASSPMWSSKGSPISCVSPIPIKQQMKMKAGTSMSAEVSDPLIYKWTEVTLLVCLFVSSDTVGNSSVSVRFVSTKWANGSFLFDYVGQWELLI